MDWFLVDGVEFIAYCPDSRGEEVLCPSQCPYEYRKHGSCHFPPKQNLLKITHHYLSERSRLFAGRESGPPN